MFLVSNTFGFRSRNRAWWSEVLKRIPLVTNMWSIARLLLRVDGNVSKCCSHTLIRLHDVISILIPFSSSSRGSSLKSHNMRTSVWWCCWLACTSLIRSRISWYLGSYLSFSFSRICRCCIHTVPPPAWLMENLFGRYIVYTATVSFVAKKFTLVHLPR